MLACQLSLCAGILNYLTEQQVIGSEMDYRTGGRPCLVYFLRK